MTNGTTPLEVAISSMYSSSDMTMILIQAGADVKAADSEGGTPLWSAVDEEPPHVVEELLKRGASPNVQIHSTGFSGWTPLHLAAMHGLKDHVELLLRYGADPTITNDEGQTALDVLMTSKYPSEEREIIANALKTNSLGSY
jgi:ankyrin repeat protein